MSASGVFEIADEAAASAFAYEQGWTDGLPIVAPTAERVNALLAHAGLAADTVIAEYAVRNRRLSAEKIAVNAVMAGCRPEYFPVVVAAIQAVADHDFHLNHIASTSSPYPFFVVNGPIVQKLGLHSGAGVLGPGREANARIGRAISLTLANCLEARIGAVQQGVLGIPSRYAGGVIAEKPDSGWEPLSEVHGLPAGASAITAIPHFMGGPQEIWIDSPDQAPDAESLARFIAEHFAFFNTASICGTHLVLLSPSMQRRFLDEGWSKARLRQWLRDNARISFAKLMGRPGAGGLWPKEAKDAEDGSLVRPPEAYSRYWYLANPARSDPLPEESPLSSRSMTVLPSDFEIVVAGAEQGPMLAALGRCYPLQPRAVTKLITSPLCS